MRMLIAVLGLTVSLGVQAAEPLVQMQTNMGTIEFKLFPDKAPTTVNNFLKYVKSGFYDGTIFHRVVKGFVIQGGGYTDHYQAKPTLPPIPNEANNGLENDAGTLAMARTYDPNSATSQFFINVDRNLFLNYYKPVPDYYGYCVFGKVVKGMDVVRKISSVPTGAEGPFPSDVPLSPIIIKKVSLVTPLGEERQASASDSKPARKKRKSPHHG